MKKVQLAAAAMLLALGMNAQQFILEYGKAVQERSSDLFKAGNGYVVAGNQTSGSTRDLILLKVDENGVALAPPFFSRQFRLFNAMNNAMRINNTQTVELPGGNILVAGSFTDPQAGVKGNGVYLATFSPSGAVLSASMLDLPFPEQGTPIVRALEISSRGTEAYVCGTTDLFFSTGDRRDFVFAVNLFSNTLIWSNFYDNPSSLNEEVADMMFSPFGDELIMVGNMTVSGTEEIYFRAVDPNTGNVLTQRSIRRANQPIRVSAITSNSDLLNPQFLICGNQQTTSTRRDVFVASVNTDFSLVNFTQVIPYSNGSSYQGDDIQVVNPGTSQAEIIVSTDIAGGLLGANDIGLLRLTMAGVPISEYTYGKSVSGETPIEMVLDNDGFAILGTTTQSVQPVNNTNVQMYLVKVSLQGIGICNYRQAQTVSSAFAPVNSLRSAITSPGLFIFQATLVNQAAVSQVENCILGRYAGNADSDNESITTEATIYPNPLSASSPLLNLNLHAPVDQQIEIRITDMLGREVLNQKIIIAGGQSIHQIQLPSSISSGVYNLSILGESISEQHRFTVE